MNRKKKILFAGVGIFIILFAIIGITYAYFVARVQGNTNTVSIRTRAGILSLVYGENQNDIIEATNILPGYTNTKNFAVTNNGSGTASYGVFLEELRNTFSRTEDLKITITCTSNVQNKECNGLTQSNFPTQNNLLITNSIDKGEVQQYTLTFEYLNVDANQNADNNASLFARVQIYDLDSTVDLEGTVTNSQPGDYVVVNSNPKRSEIVNGTFKVVGLSPDNHTINIYNESGTQKSTSSLSIVSGTEESISGTTITVVSESRTITTTVNATSNNSITVSDIERVSNGSGDNTRIETPGTLAYTIINNAKNVTAEEKALLYAEYSETPKTTPAVAVSGENESTLSKTDDDYGSSYYFRGNVSNNYVNFSGMCWRIVRIEGDGSVKIVLADRFSECSVNTNKDYDAIDSGIVITDFSKNNAYDPYGYRIDDGIYFPDYFTQSRSVRTELNNWLLSDVFPSNSKKKLKYDNWCIGDLDNGYEIIDYDVISNVPISTTELLNNNKSFYYPAAYRLYESKIPSLKCDGTDENREWFKSYIGILTSDELVFAGSVGYFEGSDNENYSYYLKGEPESNYITLNWGLHGEEWDNKTYSSIIGVGSDNSLDIYITPWEEESVTRPSITLISGISYVSGIGTSDNPYIIEE